MITESAQMWIESTHELAEGPVWHEGKLWWVDIEEGSLHNSHGGRFKAGGSLGAAAPKSDGTWLIAKDNGFYNWNLAEPPQLIWERPDAKPQERFNDGKFAPDGSFWAGTLRRGSFHGACSFYRLAPDGQVFEEIKGLGLCNGLGWDPGEGVFYYIDTGARTVFRRTVKRDGPGVAFARFEDGLPDGMCVEPGGDIWVALWGKGKVVRLDRKTGEMNGQVEVPVPQVSSCCLGPDQSLYITTASVGMSPDDGAAFPWSGSIFRCQITA